MKQKLKAFTLMELLIGMIVSSIVIAIGYSTYAIIYKQFSSYKLVKNQVVECMQLNTVLQNDIQGAEFVFFNEDQLKLDSGDKMISYHFMDSLIVRDANEQADTFKLRNTDLIPSYAANGGGIGEGLINGLILDITINENIEHFTFMKIYDAETLMKYELTEKY